MVSVIRGAGKIPLPDLPFFEAGTHGRLIAGIGAGLIPGIDAGDCAFCFGGFGVHAGYFFGVVVWGNGGADTVVE